MFPILLKLGPLTFRTYGLFIALGVIAGYNYMQSIAYLRKINREFVTNLTFFTLISGFLGGRVLYVLTEFEYYKNNFWAIFKVWEGGLIFYGGLFTGIIFGIVYAKIKKQNLLDVMDISAPAVFLAQSIGRLGCFFAGCCYGKPTESFFGITFTHPESLAPLGIKLVPIQIFESLFAFTIFLVLHYFFINNKLKNKLLFLSIIMYSIFRVIIEYFRGEGYTDIIWGLNIFQLISIILIILNFGVIIYINKIIRFYKNTGSKF